MSLRDEAAEVTETERTSSLRRERDRLRSELRQRDDELEDALTRLAVLEGVDRLDPSPPKWTVPKKRKSDAAIVVSMLTDTHWDIQVRPEDVAGVNEYETLKKRTHLKARDNLDWHLAHLVRRQLADDKRITWQIDEAPDAEFSVFQHRHVLTHGDQTSGGSGIGGVFPPIMRMVARKQQRQAGLGRAFDHLWLGHFHQSIHGPGWTCSSSLIGYDSYAADHNFPVEPPSQAVAYVTPAGVEWRSSIKP